jgi:putative aldouronate transport system substrate-binding protein
VEEFADVLRAFRDGGDLNGNGKADEIPYALDFTARDRCGSYNTFHQFTGAFGQADSYSGYTPTADHMRVLNDKIIFTATDTAYKDTAKFFHTLYKEKLLDVDSFTPGPSSTYPLFLNKAQGTEALLGVMGVWSPYNEIPDPAVRDQYQSIPRLQGPKGKTGFIPNFTELQQPSRVVITSECKYPEVIARYVDYCYEPEISFMLDYGTEGFTVEKDAGGKLRFRVDEKGEIAIFPPYKNFGDLRFNSSPHGGGFAILNEYWDTVGDYPWTSVPLLEYQIANGKYEVLSEYTPVPRLLLSNEEQTAVYRIQPAISDIIRRYTIQWVLDGDADPAWDTYLSELKAAGVEDLLKLMQDAYDRLLKAK